MTSDTYRKICILGTAPQWQAAPFEDLSYEIWGIYGLACSGKRLTRLYELHNKEIILPMIEKMYPGDAANSKYWQVANALGKNFVSHEKFEQTPNATIFDFKAKMDKYGDYFASSASWLCADAIDEIQKSGGKGEIAIYGVNMSSDGEYAHQKPSLSYLLGWAKGLGIKVTIPDSSELLNITHQYGLDKEPRFISLVAQKKAELQANLNAHRQNWQMSEKGAYAMEQCMEIVKWLEQNLVGISGSNGNAAPPALK